MGRNKRALAWMGAMGGLVRKRVRRRMEDPVRRALDSAPVDDEPLTPEDLEAIEEAKAESGPFLSPAEVRKALKLS
jgi:hypothetical protein